MDTVAQLLKLVTSKDTEAEASASSRHLHTASDVSDVLAGVSYLLTAFGVPPARRGFIAAVAAAADGRLKEFDCPDIRLGRLLYKRFEGSDKSLTQRVARERKKTMACQKEIGVTLLTYVVGGKDDQGPYPTKWSAPILAMVERLFEEAQWEHNFNLKPGEAFRRTADRIADEERRRAQPPAKRQRKPTRYNGPEQEEKTAETLVRKVVSRSKEPKEAFERASFRILTGLLREIGPIPKAEAEERLNAVVRNVLSVDGLFEPESILIPLEERREVSNLATSSPPDESAERASGEPPSSRSCPPQITPENPGRSSKLKGSTQLIDSTTYKEPENPYFEKDAPAPTSALDISQESNRAANAFRKAGIERPQKVILLRDSDKHAEPRDAGWDDLPRLAGEAAARHLSLCVRPGSASLLQIDDAGSSTLEALGTLPFLIVETSPRNYQAWLQLEDGLDTPAIRSELIAHLERLSDEKPNGGAYGSLRWPGSRNWKPERGGCPVWARWPRPLRVVTRGELLALGLTLSPPPPPRRSTEPHKRNGATPGGWPDWEACLRARDGDRFRAGNLYAHLSILAGCSDGEILTALQTHDTKGAKRRGYHEATLRSAHEYTDRRQ